MMGRERKSINDLIRLYDKDPDMVLRWLREAWGGSFDCRIRDFIHESINCLDKKRYQKVKAEVDQAVNARLEPDTPEMDQKVGRDIARLYTNDPIQVFNWSRECMTPTIFDSCFLKMIQEWSRGLNKKDYMALETVLEKGCKDFLKPDTPDNVIPFRRRA